MLIALHKTRAYHTWTCHTHKHNESSLDCKGGGGRNDTFGNRLTNITFDIRTKFASAWVSFLYWRQSAGLTQLLSYMNSPAATQSLSSISRVGGGTTPEQTTTHVSSICLSTIQSELLLTRSFSPLPPSHLSLDITSSQNVCLLYKCVAPAGCP